MNNDNYLAQWGLPADLPRPQHFGGQYYNTTPLDPQTQARLDSIALETGLPPAVIQQMMADYQYRNTSNPPPGSLQRVDKMTEKFNAPYTSHINTSPMADPRIYAGGANSSFFDFGDQSKAILRASERSGLSPAEIMRMNGLLPDDQGGWL